jgi:hypothetical protein
MRWGTVENFLLGPFYDLGRFISGSVTGPPPTRVVSEEGLAAARRVLINSGCCLSRCTVENLHSFPVDAEPDWVFDMVSTWQSWPCSSFFPCLSTDRYGATWFAYRWWKAIPVVIMKLRTAERPHTIIYDIVWGIGPGGYHAFLIDPADLTGLINTGCARATLSIFTTFPRTRLFPEGLHDRINYDISRKLQRICGIAAWPNQA